MPAFDPVRDAVLNSPVTEAPRRQSVSHPSPSPTSTHSPDSFGPRRATDLSVLLNTSSGPSSPPAPPPHVRSSSLAHILHPNQSQPPSPPDRLSRAPALQRLGSSNSSSSGSVQPLSAPFPPLSHPSISPQVRPLTSLPHLRTRTLSSPDALFTPVSERDGLFTPAMERAPSGGYFTPSIDRRGSGSLFTPIIDQRSGGLFTPTIEQRGGGLSTPGLEQRGVGGFFTPVEQQRQFVFTHPPSPTNTRPRTLSQSRPMSSHRERPTSSHRERPTSSHRERPSSSHRDRPPPASPIMPPPPPPPIGRISSTPSPALLPLSHPSNTPSPVLSTVPIPHHRPAPPPVSVYSAYGPSPTRPALPLPQVPPSRRASPPRKPPPPSTPPALPNPELAKIPARPPSSGSAPPPSMAAMSVIPVLPPPPHRPVTSRPSSSSGPPPTSGAPPEPITRNAAPPAPNPAHPSPSDSPPAPSRKRARVSPSPPPARSQPPPTTRLPASLPPRPQSPPPPPQPDPTKKTLPYNPRRRTPAGSVLIPLSPDEIAMYRAQLGQGTLRLAKRKRPLDEMELEQELGEDAPRVKRSRDAGLVVEHYNARPNVGVEQRRDSPIIGLRNFNNWIKSVLITRFAQPALQSSTVVSAPGRGGGGLRGKVLDLGCGKGGDLSKWAKSKVKEYAGLDIAAISVDQARSRHGSLRPPRSDAIFAALDCYVYPLTRALPPARLATPFDVVSMQFCMHYAFESIAKARRMLENVSTWLRPGGIMVGTIPNAEQLLERLDALPPDAKELMFGNDVYHIKFDNRENRPIYGHRYSFFLKDAVEDVPEYVVQWDSFVQLAAEYHLHPIYKKEFHDVFQEFQEHDEFKPLLQRMKVVDVNGETEMDEDQWEAANIYIAFAMEKR